MFFAGLKSVLIFGVVCGWFRVKACWVVGFGFGFSADELRLRGFGNKKRGCCPS